MIDVTLNTTEFDLLEWLGREDYSQYGECHGPALDSLIAKGLAQVHGPRRSIRASSPNDPPGTKGAMYRAVSLTEAGCALLRGKQS